MQLPPTTCRCRRCKQVLQPDDMFPSLAAGINSSSDFSYLQFTLEKIANDASTNFSLLSTLEVIGGSIAIPNNEVCGPGLLSHTEAVDTRMLPCISSLIWSLILCLVLHFVSMIVLGLAPTAVCCSCCCCCCCPCRLSPVLVLTPPRLQQQICSTPWLITSARSCKLQTCW